MNGPTIAGVPSWVLPVIVVVGAASLVAIALSVWTIVQETQVGESGSPGQAGNAGNSGNQGVKGEQGQPGKEGPKGPAGKNAVFPSQILTLGFYSPPLNIDGMGTLPPYTSSLWKVGRIFEAPGLPFTFPGTENGQGLDILFLRYDTRYVELICQKPGNYIFFGKIIMMREGVAGIFQILIPSEGQPTKPSHWNLQLAECIPKNYLSTQNTMLWRTDMVSKPYQANVGSKLYVTYSLQTGWHWVGANLFLTIVQLPG